VLQGRDLTGWCSSSLREDMHSSVSLSSICSCVVSEPLVPLGELLLMKPW
jgi:hypothetical protein